MKKLDQTQAILVVEDSDDDYEIMMDAFAESSKVLNPIIRCESGRSALDFLLRRPPYDSDSNWHLPGIVLLDLNLPGIDGRQVLQEVKQNPQLNRIPVIVLTTSNDEKDVDACYALGANTYIQKPVDFGKFMEAIQRLKDYWFKLVILPKE